MMDVPAWAGLPLSLTVDDGKSAQTSPCFELVSLSDLCFEGLCLDLAWQPKQRPDCRLHAPAEIAPKKNTLPPSPPSPPAGRLWGAFFQALSVAADLIGIDIDCQEPEITCQNLALVALRNSSSLLPTTWPKPRPDNSEHPRIRML